MADEIIKLFEYFMNTPGVYAILVVYAAVMFIFLIIIVAVFAVVLKQFFDIHKRNKRR